MVLYVSPLTGLGGGETSLLELAKRVRQRGYRPVLLCPSDGPLVDAWSEAGMEAHIQWFNHPRLGAGGLFRSLSQMAVFGRMLRSLRVEVVHANDVRPAAEVCLAARALGIPVVWSCHIAWRPASRAARLAARWAASKVLAVSHFVAQVMREANYVSQSRVRVVHLGVDVHSWSPKEPPGGLRDQLGVGDAELVTWVGRFQEVKDVDTLLDATLEVATQYPNVRFLLLGDASLGGAQERRYQERILARIREDGVLCQHVKPLGFRSDVRDILRASGVAVLTSRQETFGMGLVEAMACGVPVVSTACGGPEEIIADGGTGFLVPVGDAKGIAASLLRLLQDAELRSQMGRAARERAVEFFDLERYVTQVEHTYREVMWPR